MPRLAQLNPVERLQAVTSVDHEDRPFVLTRLRPNQIALPKSRLRPLAETPMGRRLERLVTVLGAFDRCLEEVVGYKAHIYLLGDDGAGALLRLLQPRQPVTSTSMTRDLEILATCGLIYRFNVALKFGYKDRGLMQVRLNGWGRHLVESAGLAALPRYANLAPALRETLTPHVKMYRAQIRLCSSDDRPLQVDRIHALNRILPVMVVT